MEPKNCNNDILDSAVLRNTYNHSDTELHHSVPNFIEVMIKEEYFSDEEFNRDSFCFPEATESRFIFFIKKNKLNLV